MESMEGERGGFSGSKPYRPAGLTLAFGSPRTLIVNRNNKKEEYPSSGCLTKH